MLLGRADGPVGRLYFADLIGAGLGCVLAIPLIMRVRAAGGGVPRGRVVRRGRGVVPPQPSGAAAVGAVLA